MLTLKESTRWLTSQGRDDEAWESLVWVRGSDSQATVNEMEEIRTGVAIEAHEREGFRLKGAPDPGPDELRTDFVTRTSARR